MKILSLNIQKIKNGDIDAFETLFRQYAKSLVRFAHSYVNDLGVAEDIVQNVFLLVWENRSNLKADSNLRAYLFTLTRNRCLNNKRHQKIEEKFSNESEIEIINQDSPLQFVQQQELERLIHLAIQALPSKCYHIFCMNRFDKLTYAEIAECVWGYSPVIVGNMADKTHNCGTLRFDARCRPGDDKTSSSFYVNALDGLGIAANNTLYEERGGPDMDILNVTDVNNKMIIGDPTKIELHEPHALSFHLFQNYPNPFNPETIIRYQIVNDTHVTIRILNPRGQLVRTLTDKFQKRGAYAVSWDGLNQMNQPVASGLYFCQIQANEMKQTAKMTLIR